MKDGMHIFSIYFHYVKELMIHDTEKWKNNKQYFLMLHVLQSCQLFSTP